jgi:hypothetical protein
LPLAVDASTLGARFVVLSISVLYRGCAILVAWRIVRAGEKGTYRPVLLRLLRQLWRATPTGLYVMVMADRGLYARWLFRRIVRLGWHPLLRINSDCYFRPHGECAFRPLRSFAPQVGSHCAVAGSAFASPEARLDATLLCCWQEGHKDAWFILTDVAPDSASACWYGLHPWIEQGFRAFKRGCFQWQATRMRDPQRASRLWLVMAVVTLFLLATGTDQQEPDDPG